MRHKSSIEFPSDVDFWLLRAVLFEVRYLFLKTCRDVDGGRMAKGQFMGLETSSKVGLALAEEGRMSRTLKLYMALSSLNRRRRLIPELGI